MPIDTHAWSGALTSLVATPRAALLARLQAFIQDATPAQVAAWEHELAVLQEQGATVIELHPAGGEHATVLEYMLPREAGRRPDVLVLQNGRVVVVEFKETGRSGARAAVISGAPPTFGDPLAQPAVCHPAVPAGLYARGGRGQVRHRPGGR